ncbi:MAG: carboxypeptidase regulatory-like domain-containing protein [Proteobacteria bacterium]|nr:carboxypeptidase regulatory-like domain-containing protein [Pseudomonadota bacterium]
MKPRAAIASTVVALSVISLTGAAYWHAREHSRTTGIATAQDAGMHSGGGPEARPRIGGQSRENLGVGPYGLRGAVFDAAGNPVQRAEITAEFELGPGVEGLASAGRAHRAPGPDAGSGGDTGFVTTATISATSGQDGTFELVGLDAGRYRLRVEGAGLFTSEVRFFDVPADGIRLIVARKVSVRGNVVTESGAPAAGIAVTISGESLAMPLSVASDELGRFEFDGLQEGMFRVWAAAGARAARAVRVSRLGSGPFGAIRLALEPAAVVTGRVVERKTGRGIAAAIALSATTTDEPTRHGQSGSDGEFRIAGVLDGRWSLEAFAPGYISVEAIEFAAGGPFIPRIALSRGGIISGRVVDSSGVPVAGAIVSARGTDSQGHGRIVSQASLARDMQRAQGGTEHIPPPQAVLPLAAGHPAAPLAESSAAHPSPEPPAGLAPSQRFLPRGELGVLLGPIPYPPPTGAAALRIAQSLEQAAVASSGSPIGPAESDPIPIQPDLAPVFITDDDGRFRVPGLRSGRYRILVTHVEYADAWSQRLAIRPDQTIDNVTVTVFRGIILTGQVTNTRGEVVVGAAVIADRVEPGPAASRPVSSQARAGVAAGVFGPISPHPDAASRIQAVTGLDGRYRLGPIAHPVNLQVTAVRHGDIHRTVKPGKLPEHLTERTENFVLPVADAGLVGRIVDPVGFPVRQADVRIVSGGRGVEGRKGRTDEHGRFEIAAIPPGRYRLSIRHADFPESAAEGKTDEQIRVTVQFGGGIAGWARDGHTGNPIAGARIAAIGPDKTTAETAARSDGSVTLGPLRPGKWTITTRAPGYVTRRQTVEVAAGRQPGQITVRDLALSLARGAIVAGVVRNQFGERVRGAVVRIGALTTKTDENGRFRLRDVATGTMVIEAERTGQRGSLTVELNPGDEMVSLDIALQPHPDPEEQDSSE